MNPNDFWINNYYVDMNGFVHKIDDDSIVINNGYVHEIFDYTII